MTRIFFALIIGLLLSRDTFAWGLKEFGEEIQVPYTTSSKYALLGGTLLTLGFVVSEDQVGDPFQIETVRNKPLGDSSKLGDILGQMVPNFLYIGGMGIASRYGDTKAHDRAIGMLKATLYSSAVTTVLKYSIREPRPNDQNTRNSFPSGHTTTSFAFTGYVFGEHGWAWGVPALAMSFFTGYSRINDNAHRLHDVIAGATIGWVYGYGMSRLDKQRKADENCAYIAPILDTKTAGLSVYKEF